jgi:DNA-binding CsgD family transcriptional regulator
MKTIQFSLLLIWLILLFFNLFLIWKYLIKSQKPKLTSSLNSDKVDSSFIDDDFEIPLQQNQLQELSNLKEETKKESDLAQHTEIQQLVAFFKTSNLPITNTFEKPIEVVEPASKKPIEVSGPTFKVKNRNLRKKLLSIHPDLTEQELWLCELIITKKSITEISEIMKLAEGTVRVYKTKLKLKLNLSHENSLKAYLNKLYEMK